MNDAPQQNKKKDSILKTLAITGFIGIIILIAWLSIQFVKIAPDAFTSLASLAEGLRANGESALEAEEVDPLIVTSNIVLVNAGEAAELSWDSADTQGSYAFSYECAEGVAVDIIDNDGNKSIACDTNYNIGNVDSLSIIIDSEKNRYTDINYTVSFLGTNDAKPRAEGKASLTVINNQVKNDFASNDTGSETEIAIEEITETETEEVAEEDVEEVVETETEVAVEETEEVVETETPAETPAETIPEPVTPTYQQEFTYTIPVSDPNGRVDLSTKYINSGTIVGNTFFAEEIMQEEKGAIQFEVKNYGTKTSDTWTFEVSLPNGGEYVSTEQRPLKPNERAVLTIGFFTTDDSSHKFEVKVIESTDKNTLNDQFTKIVKFIE